MEPIKYVELLNQRYRMQGFPPYEWTRNGPPTLTPLRKPLDQCRVSVLTSGGVSHCSMPDWDPEARNDFRLDAIDPDADSSDFAVNDSYYDTHDATRDVNTIFPLDRLRELAQENVIGSVAPRLWSGFMGRIYKRSHVVETAAPAWAAELHADDVDLALLVPA